ncbi:hypothetical protein NN561_005427 [Cricetulus griseus]
MGSTASEHLSHLEQIPSHLGAGERKRDTGTHLERPGGGGSSWLQSAEDLADKRFGAVSSAHPERGLLGFQSKRRYQGSLEGGACGLGDFIHLANPGLPERSLTPAGSEPGRYLRYPVRKLLVFPNILAGTMSVRISVPYRQVTRLRILCSVRGPGGLRSHSLHLALQRVQEPLEKLA